MSRKKVLIVSYWFPPAGGIAVQRALSLAKYLPQYGLEVHVLAPTNPPSPVIDPSLLKHIPAEVKIHRAITPSPSAKLRKRIWGLLSPSKAKESSTQTTTTGSHPLRKYLTLSNLVQRILCPDPEVVWVPFAIRKAKQIVRKHGIDVVIVTAPPFSAFLIGLAIKREFPQIQFISDFRDEWLRFFLSTFDFQRGGHIRARAEQIERETVECSDAILTVTTSLVQEMRERYPDQNPAKFISITNGYDPAIFSNFKSRPHETGKTVITYVGTVYKTTSPKCYFDVVDRLPEDLRDKIETRFVGRIAEDQQALISSRSNLKLYGYVSQAEALRCMEETDYLLLTMSDPSFATGKIYEYLASGKPIIAFSPIGGEVAHVIAETGAGWCLDPPDVVNNAEFFSAIALGKGMKFNPNADAIRSYERPRLAEKFADVISNLLKHQGSFETAAEYPAAVSSK